MRLNAEIVLSVLDKSNHITLTGGLEILLV